MNSCTKRLTEEKGREILYTWIEIEPEKILEQRRWYLVCQTIKQSPDGRYFLLKYEKPSTELQEGQDWNFVLCEVKPEIKKLVKITEWVNV